MPPAALEVGRRIQDGFEDLQRTAVAEAPLTVCHGDYRLDNLLFGTAASGEIAVLDWQLTHRGPAAQDLAMFLTQSLPVDLRRRHEGALVRRWHAALTARIGVAAGSYPVELAYDHYRRMSLYATVIPVILGGGMDTTNERGLALTTTVTVRSFTAVLDLAAGELLG